MTTTTTEIPVPLRTLAHHGVAIWLDDLSRDRLNAGDLQRLVRTRGIVGVTSNPTIFEKAVRTSDAYAEDLDRLAEAQATAEHAARRLVVDDVRRACDLLAPVAERTDGVDGRVSIEVDPRLAHDTERTVQQAHELWAQVDRPNLFVKIPATRAGLPAITQCLADGLSINVTLTFSLRRYDEVLDAFESGLEQRLARGGSLAGIASVASFFVSRVDTEVDERLDTVGTDAALALRGQAAVANARLAYRAYTQRVASERWLHLEAQGARPQRPLWASTSVKNPDYPDTMYVTELVAPDTVSTMPESTLEAVAELPDIAGGTITSNVDEAQATIHALERVGVDMEDVADVLESEGVQKFTASWNDVLATVDTHLTGS
jgi:transaldolase